MFFFIFSGEQKKIHFGTYKTFVGGLSLQPHYQNALLTKETFLLDFFIYKIKQKNKISEKMYRNLLDTF